MNADQTRVLLVEDSAVQAELIRDMLDIEQDRRFVVDVARSLGEAGGRLGETLPDLVLLDLGLPDGKGLGSVRRVRQAAPRTPLIVLTNVHDEILAIDALREGAQDYLIKRDVDARLLLRSIRYALERGRAEEALRESEERYMLAVAGANDGLWDWCIARNTAYYSPRWRSLAGLTGDEEHRGIDAWLERVHAQDVEGLRSALDAHLAGKTDHFEHEHRLLGPDRQYLWVLSRGLAVRGADGNAYRMAGSLTDITRRKLAEAQLLHDALHDSLTKLPNRALFMDRLEIALKRFKRDETSLFALLFFDLDRFKNVNDSLGHAVGDELLMNVARRLEKFLRPGDTVARLGGDEFAILVADVTDARHAASVAERVHELLSEVFIIRAHEVYVSASIGIALSTPGYERPEDILRDADLAMYRAKTSTTVTYEVFDSAMHDSVVALHRLEMDLRRAVEHHEFLVHYQTIVDLESNRILGFEALLRWDHPQWGIVNPEYFIHVAEETGLIVPIGWWVLREACQQARMWQRMFPVDPMLTMSVNVSGKQFLHSDVTARIAQILDETGLPPDTLRLEITERAIMSHADEVLFALGDLRKLGIRLYIDDFGTGYSSLTYLQRFSYDSLKIDRSFVHGMGEAADGNAIVKAIVALGNSLGMQVIAEGVETPEQLATLRELDCHGAQGFWFSRPMGPGEMRQHLTERFAT